KYLTNQDSQTYPTFSSGESPESRKAWPPPLQREGEKTQPGWLFQFLRNPTPIRPAVKLRMPRFNMSEEETMDLVNYFAAADRLSNPGIGLTYPYVPSSPQRDDAFWQAQSREYFQRLKAQKLDEARLADLTPLWDRAYSEQL